MRQPLLNWFSPLPPAQTGIARYTEFLLPALAEKFRIRLWTEQQSIDSALEQWATIHLYGHEHIPLAELRKADVTVYNLGNDQRFHAGIWRVSQQFPGVVLLHDARLHHLFLGAFRDRWNDREGYVRLLEKWYGPSAHADANRSWEGSLDTNSMTMRWPLTEAAVDKSLAVIVHNGAVQRQVREYGDRPVIYTPIPHSQVVPLHTRRTAKPPFRLLVFGHLGTNRRVESLLTAWGQMPERDQFRLDVAGAPWNRFELMELIRRNGLYRHVFVHGFVSDTKLSELLDRADLGINLRYPSMGEASGSLLRMWEHALAAMVTKVGWYSALPADCVAFVEQQRESEDIQRHLRDFAAAPEKYAKIGLRGHHRVINRHTPQQFAEALLRLTGELNQQQLAREIHGLAARVAGKIRGLEPEHKRGGVSTRVAKHLDELFGDQTQEPG